MTSIRLWRADDMFHMANVNLDPLTETYNISFYFSYLARWPDYFHTASSPTSRHNSNSSEKNGMTTMGYVMGKAEGRNENWHGHVTALTVSPQFRRLGLANQLMEMLEEVSDKMYSAYFVDLFVRESNSVAIGMYEKMGYSVYRRVLEYYTGSGAAVKDEDAFDMRKAMSRDSEGKSVIPLNRPVRPEELDFD